MKNPRQLSAICNIKFFCIVFVLLSFTQQVFASYCTSNGGTSWEYISGFTINGATQNSGKSGYHDYTGSTFTTMIPGNIYSFTITYTIPGSVTGVQDQAAIYMDLNEDGDFNDAGETLYASSTQTRDNGVHTFSSTLTIPGGTSAGTKRMRVVLLFVGAGNTMSPCLGNYAIDGGETEDYDVVISSCTAPTLPTVTPTETVICPGGASTLNITGTLNSATAWHIYTGSCGGTSIGTTSNSTFLVNPSGNTTYYIRGEGGCVTPGSCGTASVSIANAPVIAVLPADTAVCSGDHVTLAASGAEPGVKAVLLDGVNDYVNIPHHNDLRPNGGITLSAWVKIPSTTGTWQFIIGKETPGEKDYLLAVTPSNNVHGRFQVTGGGWREYNTAAAVPYNEWTHVAATYDNTTLKVYINGSEALSENWSQALNMSGASNPVTLGIRGDNDMPLAGEIDEVSIWSRALTPAEIEHVMHFNAAEAGSGLVGHWQLNEGTGTSTADASGNGHHGTLTNGAQWTNSYAGIDFADYQWSPATGLSGTTGNSVTATFASDIIYTVSYITYQGCTATAQIELTTGACLPVWSGTGNWTDNPNWTVAPTSTDSVVVLSGNVTVNTNATVNDLTLESGTSLIVSSSNTLIITGNYINNGGTFTVQNGGQIVFQNELRKGVLKKMKTFGTLRVKSGSITLMN